MFLYVEDLPSWQMRHMSSLIMVLDAKDLLVLIEEAYALINHGYLH